MARAFIEATSFVAVIASAVLTACQPATAAKAPVAAPSKDAMPEIERYLPLENGTVFSYDTQSEQSSAHGLLIVQVSRPRTGRVDLRMGSRTERLQFVPDGIAYVEGGYLLKTPVAKGTTWRGRTGTVHIESTEETATVPAGKFDGCVRTVEEAKDSGLSRTISQVYCPHVGLVMVDVEGMTAEGHNRETAVLRSFGPRVDLTTEPVTTTTDD
ncbi:MAG TPA: hypothetical protein VH062_21630 [Polyangiaceae bacterium]|jgi:hypothetical protein|nr:hypothetical protein [Polyangiaceae bacterium]